MKRIKYLAVLLLAVGVLGLTGCGNDSSDAGTREIIDESQTGVDTEQMDEAEADGEDAGNETDAEDSVQNR